MQSNEYIFGLRAIIEAIQSGKEIDKVFLKKDLRGELATELTDLLRANRIVFQRVPVEKLNRITRKNHQGAIALISAVTYHKLEYIVPQLYEQGAVPFIVMLDGITDVRNFGAIARTCECAGVHAIVIPTHGSVSVGADAVKTSAGALLRIPVCRVDSMAQAAGYLKDSGFEVTGITEKATETYSALDYSTPTALVFGSEDTGISPQVLSRCNRKAAIPMFGRIGSLNVSVAAGIAIYGVVQSRLNAGFEG